ARRILLLAAATLLAACSDHHAGFPADHCTQDCVTGDQVLVIEPANPLLLVSGERQLSATIVNGDGSRRHVTGAVSWSSDATPVFTVSSGGAVTGMAPGQGTVQARTPTLQAQANVRVSGLTVQQLHVTPAFDLLLPGMAQQYTASAVLADGTTVDVTNL